MGQINMLISKSYSNPLFSNVEAVIKFQSKKFDFLSMLYRVTHKNGTAYFPQYVNAITSIKMIPRSAILVQWFHWFVS